MKCQEVIELIQRHLDQDLTEDEALAMHKHMEQCDACSGMFERMVKLSEELVNLPKVTPAFSLVDQILPRLQEIDQHRNEGLKLNDDGHPLNEQPIAAYKPGWLIRLKQAASFKSTGWVSAAVLLIVVLTTISIPLISNQGDEASESLLDMAESSGAMPDANEIGRAKNTFTSRAQVVTSSDQVLRNDRTSGEQNTRGSVPGSSRNSEAPEVMLPLVAEQELPLGSLADEPGISSYSGVPVKQQGESAPNNGGNQEFWIASDVPWAVDTVSEQPAPEINEVSMMGELPVVTSSAQVNRKEISMSASGEWTAYIEESGGLYRLSVHETDTEAALYVGAFLETEDVPQLEWSEDDWVIMRYKLDNESYRLAVNAQARIAENVRE